LEVYQLNDNVSVGEAPDSEGDLEELAEQGYQAILNVQEPDAACELSARDEALAARSRGVFFLNFPVDNDVSELDVDQFCGKLKLLPPPTYVHGTGDGKAAALAVIALAKQNGWSVQEASNLMTNHNLACCEGDWCHLVAQHIS